MRELQAGVWHWEAPHPDWKPVERFDAAVFVPSPEEGEPTAGRRLYSAGEQLPVGVQAFLGMDANDFILWVESHGAVVAGDAIIDRGNGLEIPADWVA